MKYILMLLFLVGCANTHTSYIDPNLKQHALDFQTDAQARGIKINLNHLTLVLGNLPDSISGQCTYKRRKILGQVEIDYSQTIVIHAGYYDRARPLEVKAVVYHEMGHCFLQRGHKDDVNFNVAMSLMHSDVLDMVPYYILESNWLYYVNELIGENK